MDEFVDRRNLANICVLQINFILLYYNQNTHQNIQMAETLVRSLLVPFLTGGIIVAGVKYSAANLKNIKLAALIGAFPIGLFSIYFLNTQQAYSYGWNYGIMTTILLSSVVIFNILFKYVKLSKDVSHFLSIVAYFGIAAIHFYL